ncbi:Nif3-like dinuclear metal center hexameric protein [Isobaculum melis]|uniref:GTP cyclohydrolase 1 type 2 homolog n=1 Tax=Isobaculum melis TaxID=142588 RepID=A0A1H9R3Q2_9LACT|nr:Nif3-like dinuclear metal center hexameric protein [Isobaculum melis]SER67471.1 dinuclear metal center protein, YbgI/SA1388 family [Isobaculum melis]
MSKINGKTLIEHFEQFAPPYLAESGDPIGLQIGTLNKPIHKVMVSLDVRQETVQEAIAQQIDLIIVHHPPIFVKPANLVIDDPQKKLYADLIKHDIAVYAAHTNLDVTTNGMNDWLGQAIGLTNTIVMSETKKIGYKKLAVFVPSNDAEKMRQALAEAGAGSIGPHYKNCSYTLTGTGRFTPVTGAMPTIGSINQAEAVSEAKVEVIFPETLTTQVEHAMFAAHPYEEPAYDLYTIENFYDSYGLGRVGDLAEPIKVKDFAQQLKAVFKIDGLRVVSSDLEKLVQRVAICGGAAGKYYPDAMHKKADVYITGDVDFHTAQYMLADGLTVIDPGHHIEAICTPKLNELLTNWAVENQWELEVIASQLNTDPFKFM